MGEGVDITNLFLLPLLSIQCLPLEMPVMETCNMRLELPSYLVSFSILHDYINFNFCEKLYNSCHRISRLIFNAKLIIIKLEACKVNYYDTLKCTGMCVT